ncbi:CehA/McbA family metallohydrolase [Actinomyces provencensis]|uniref:CehA/McbA family metallohydrolase n=1 Tax=Actinomyces provencensis TaxID=1720198 RepID=UPI00098F10B0|nr:CehA/McbA family metallohydrolase [Actinomyces provencensis]
MTQTVTEMHVDLSTQATDRYPRVPFDLREGDTSFEVFLEVDDVEGACIDLGCEGPDGWRGWSGGARRSFVVSQEDATPGYLPGGVHAGRWWVVLGVHTVPAAGVDLKVRVVSPAVDRPDHGPVEDPVHRERRGSDRDLPAPAGMRWYAGDTHSHSLHSDGALSLWELANEGVRSGLDFLCVTDHNTTSHHAHLAAVGERQGITLVAGQEVTTHMGHANAFGRIGFIDFRRPAREWVEDVAGRGGILSVNHPVSGDCSWIHELDRVPRGVELCHSTWYQEPHGRSVIAWMLRWERDVVVLGGGDFHNRSTPVRPGLPTTWVAAEECSEEAILEGMREGRTTVTTSGILEGGVGRPVHAGVPVLIREGARLRPIDAEGTVLVSLDGRRRMVRSRDELVTAPEEDGPYRLEDASRTVLAVCS